MLASTHLCYFDETGALQSCCHVCRTGLHAPHTWLAGATGRGHNLEEQVIRGVVGEQHGFMCLCEVHTVALCVW